MISGTADITANDADSSEYDVLFTLQNMVFSAALARTEASRQTPVPDAQNGKVVQGLRSLWFVAGLWRTTLRCSKRWGTAAPRP